MRRKDVYSVPATGSSSLLVIFAVLCLVVLALLTLNTALAEKRLSEVSAQTVSGWYAADLQAQEIFAKIRNGEAVPGVEQEKGIYRYSIAVSENQTLAAAVRKTAEDWEVLSWQTIAHPKDGEGVLPVWRGLNEEG